MANTFFLVFTFMLIFSFKFSSGFVNNSFWPSTTISKHLAVDAHAQVDEVVDGKKKRRPPPPPPSPPPPFPPPPPPPEPGYYKFVYQWAPSYCAHLYARCQTGHRPGEFSIHGLWPEAVRGKGSDVKFELSELKGEPEAKLKKIMPDLSKFGPGNENLYSGFWHHEWTKHGRKSGKGVREYFENIILLHDKVGFVALYILGTCQPDLGKKCDPLQMELAFQNRLKSEGKPPIDVQIRCTFNSHGQEQIQEIWLHVNKDGKTIGKIFPKTNCSGEALFQKK